MSVPDTMESLARRLRDRGIRDLQVRLEGALWVASAVGPDSRFAASASRSLAEAVANAIAQASSPLLCEACGGAKPTVLLLDGRRMHARCVPAESEGDVDLVPALRASIGGGR